MASPPDLTTLLARLAASGVEFVLVGGAPVRVLRLSALAELKRGSTAPKDRLTLAVLEETLRKTGG